MKKIIGMFLIVGMFGSISMATEMPSALETFGAVAGEQNNISIPAPTLTKSLPGLNEQVLTRRQIRDEIALREEIRELLYSRYFELYTNSSQEDKKKAKVTHKALSNIMLEIEQLRAMLSNSETTIPSIYQVAEMKAEIPNLEHKLVMLEAELSFSLDQFAMESSSSMEKLKQIKKISKQIEDTQNRIAYIKNWK